MRVDFVTPGVLRGAREYSLSHATTRSRTLSGGVEPPNIVTIVAPLVGTAGSPPPLAAQDNLQEYVGRGVPDAKKVAPTKPFLNPALHGLWGTCFRAPKVVYKGHGAVARRALGAPWGRFRGAPHGATGGGGVELS